MIDGPSWKLPKASSSGWPSQMCMAFLFLLSLCPSLSAEDSDLFTSVKPPQSPPQPDFRVVSTRRCPFDSHCRCEPESFDYFHLNHEEQWQSTDFQSFSQSLSPDRSLCVFVHGNLVTWGNAFQEGWQAASAMHSVAPADTKMTYVMFTWPSDRATVIPGLDVEVKAQRSDITAFYIARFIQDLPALRRVCLIGHSHGARAVAGALQLLAGGSVAGQCLPAQSDEHVLPEIRAVFLAGTLDHNSLTSGNTYDRVLQSAESILNVHNSQDSILGLYPLRMPFAESAIGKVGLRLRDWRNLGAMQDRIHQIDVARIIGSEHGWVAYFQQPAVTSAIAPHTIPQE